MKKLLVAWLAAAASLLSTGALATYVFTTIDYPGAVFTDVRGIDNTGRIVGYASLDGADFFAFSYEAGVYAPLPAHPPYDINAHGINDLGEIVGAARHPSGAVRGFIRGAGGYTIFARPGWEHTWARAIDATGRVTGYSEDSPTGPSAGFIYDSLTGAYTDISPPGSLFTIAQGINAAGQVVGSAILPAGGAHGFLREPDGTLVLFQVGGEQTRARGINDMGLIAGFTGSGASLQGFVGNASGFQVLEMPGADETIAEDINNAGQVVGLYRTGGGTVTRGFLATPATMPTGTTASGAYVFSVDVVPNVPIFLDPPVAVGYDYDIGRHDPRFATVRLPIGIGDSRYVVKVKGSKFEVAGGELLDFRANGFPKGVDAFRVSCIEVSAGVDPFDPAAFPTEVTFTDAGTFTGTMRPLTRSANARGKGNCRDD